MFSGILFFQFFHIYYFLNGAKAIVRSVEAVMSVAA